METCRAVKLVEIKIAYTQLMNILIHVCVSFISKLSFLLDEFSLRRLSIFWVYIYNSFRLNKFSFRRVWI